MPRANRSVPARARHKKVLKLAKGYKGARSKVYRVAKQAVIKAGQYAYIGRIQNYAIVPILERRPYIKKYEGQQSAIMHILEARPYIEKCKGQHFPIMHILKNRPYIDNF
jgi:hypothetical protein